jgi:NadR type nicotinamide-nucleotide adenylyltransferase
MDKEIKKIVVVGPESSGKTTLCRELAARFNGQLVEEYAREHLTGRGPEYRFDDLLPIAQEQMAREDRAAEKARKDAAPLFIDTDLLVMKVWSEFVFGNCHAWILNQLAVRPYDLYLLCKPDLPWEKDPLREHPDPHTRNSIHNLYLDFLINQHIPWFEVGGTGEMRLENAAERVLTLLKK